MALPLFVRKFIVDFIDTGLALIFAITVLVPGNVEDVRQIALVVGAAVLSALVSALRRAIPGFMFWLSAKLGTDEGNG